jgi:hypothetical protein
MGAWGTGIFADDVACDYAGNDRFGHSPIFAVLDWRRKRLPRRISSRRFR